MPQKIDIQAFLAAASPDEVPIIDVRSPSEFAQGHIPGAVSLPLFDDDERAEIGTLYKKKGRQKAIDRGLEIIGPNMATLVQRARRLTPGPSLRIHCWRGGMRSESMGWLMEMGGFEVTTLVGGYKAFRQHVLAELGHPLELLIIGGKTGSGKTDILKALAAQGEQTIDLEGLANHKGSAFGALGQEPQPTGEFFENQLYHAVSRLDRSRRIWVEDESHGIGRVHIPQPFWKQMKKAPVIVVDLPIKVRIERLVREYAYVGDDDLAESLQRIERRLGGRQVKTALEALKDKDYHIVAEIALQYYDKAYLYGLSQRPVGQAYPISFTQDTPDQTATSLIRYATQHLIKV